MEIILLLWNGLVAVVLFRLLRKPEDLYSGTRRGVIMVVTGSYILFALLPITERHTAFFNFYIAWPLIYAILLRDRLNAWLSQTLGGSWFRLLVSMFLFLWITELGTAVDLAVNRVNPAGHAVSYGAREILTHMLSYAGFYVGLSFVLTYSYRKWNVPVLVAYVIGGLWGVLIEQHFRGPSLLASGAPFDFLAFGSFIFPVYGLYLAGPRLLFQEEINTKLEHAPGKTTYVFLFLAVAVVPLAVWGLWNGLLTAIGIDVSKIA